MNDKLKYELLLILAFDGDILELIHKGYEFGQIKKFIDDLRLNYKYIEYDLENILIVTQNGVKFIKEFEKKEDINLYSEPILPRKEMWGRSKNKFSIYFPKKKVTLST